jgi:hypothetical protein
MRIFQKMAVESPAFGRPGLLLENTSVKWTATNADKGLEN